MTISWTIFAWGTLSSFSFIGVPKAGHFQHLAGTAQWSSRMIRASGDFPATQVVKMYVTRVQFPVEPIDFRRNTVTVYITPGFFSPLLYAGARKFYKYILQHWS